METPSESCASHARPLVVDLDGTLIHSDLLLESLVALIRQQPGQLWRLPGWLSQGRASLKREIAQRVQLSFDTLPLHAELFSLLQEEKAKGRFLVLATASDATLAIPLAAQLGLFDQIMASDGEINLQGRAKADRLLAAFGEQGFDYAGNSAADLAVWSHARRCIVVNGTASIQAHVLKRDPNALVIRTPPPTLMEYLRALRVYQWVKNSLLFVPMLFAHFFDAASFFLVLQAFIAFGFCASSVYVLNDLLDLEEDRHHPDKRLRPMTCGRIPLLHGFLGAPLLLAIALVVAWMIQPAFFGMLLLYYALTLLYSLRIKHIVLLDVFVLATLYTVRIFAGGMLLDIPISFWLLLFSIHIFLSLAMLKRYGELIAQRDRGRINNTGRDYHVTDLAMLAALGGASGYLSVLVLGLYIHSVEVTRLYRSAMFLWPICILMLFWISRMWLLAHRGKIQADPVLFALKDPGSQWIGVLVALFFSVGTFW
ncbi:MAG: UbiA family prenyltransferase [Magnetococcales bacterium]|nr:UbiA family prenyltransferase [Magnetococcales bacterium]